jgi:hypothetical protein
MRITKRAVLVTGAATLLLAGGPRIRRLPPLGRPAMPERSGQ